MARYNSIILFIFLFCYCDSPQQNEQYQNETTQSAEQLALVSSQNGEWLKAAQLYENLHLKDLSNEQLNYEAGTNYLRANYPQKALSILNRFDKKKEDKTRSFNGRIARIAKANYQLGKYKDIEELVKDYKYPKMYRGLAREHLKALIRLNKIADLDNSFSTYKKEKIYDDKGKPTNIGFLYRAICNELLLVGNDNLLQVYADHYHNWAINRQEKDQRNFAISAFYLRDFEKAIRHLKIAINVEKSPRHRIELLGLLGISYAHNKEESKAVAQIEEIKHFKSLPLRHDTFGAKYYHQSRIEVALNKKEKAISSLQKALASKAAFWSNRFKEDGLQRNLFGHLSFEALTAHKDTK